MKRICCLAAVMAVGLSVCTPASARKWTDASGKHTVEADLVQVVGDSVQLKKSEGKIITVPLAKLSDADQAFLRALAKSPMQQKPSGEAKIRAELVKKTKFAFVDTPLQDAIAFVQDLHGIPVFIDERGLDDIGLGTDTPLSATSDKNDLQTMLDRVLGPVGLTSQVRNEVLVITTAEEAEANLATQVYKVIKPIDGDALIGDIAKNIAPDSWNDVGGPGSLGFAPFGALVVSQTQDVQRQIAKHYKDTLRPVQRLRPPVIEIPGNPLPKALAAKTNCQFVETPLQDVVDFLADLHKTEVRLDKKALADIGIGPDTPVGANLRDISLASALNLVLGQLDLTFTADKTSILITTPEAAEAKLLLASYAAKDLGDLDWLAEIVTTSIAPDTWDEVGGPASARAGARGTLDVRQTLQGHQRIAALFDDLRQARKP